MIPSSTDVDMEATSSTESGSFLVWFIFMLYAKYCIKE